MSTEVRGLIGMDVTSAIASAKTTLKRTKLRTNRPKIVSVTGHRGVDEELRTT